MRKNIKIVHASNWHQGKQKWDVTLMTNKVNEYKYNDSNSD